jgi:hypothetical protein
VTLGAGCVTGRVAGGTTALIDGTGELLVPDVGVFLPPEFSITTTMAATPQSATPRPAAVRRPRRERDATGRSG